MRRRIRVRARPAFVQATPPQNAISPDEALPLVMVLGHSGCGAIDAAIKVVRDKATLPGHLQQVVREIGLAVEAAKADKPDDLLAAAIAENVRRGRRRLETAKPILAEFVASKKIKVVGAQYELASGKITLL